MKKLPPSPIEVLITIVNLNETDNVLKILKEFGEINTLVVLGHGTAESEIIDLFGFGVIERTITFTIIQTKNSSLLVEKICNDLQFETEARKGLVFTLPINSIEKNFLNQLKNSWEKTDEQK